MSEESYMICAYVGLELPFAVWGKTLMDPNKPVHPRSKWIVCFLVSAYIVVRACDNSRKYRCSVFEKVANYKIPSILTYYS